MARKKYKAVPNQKVVLMERIDKTSHRLSLSCGHYSTVGDPIKGKLPQPERRKCHKCFKGLPVEFKVPKAKK